MPEKTLGLDQVNADLVKQILRNLVIECASNTQAVIKSGLVAGADSGDAVITLGADKTVDITVSGAGGLDTGSEAADTWYYIWAILNPATGATAGLLSASASAPTMPSGYTKKRLVGAVRNGGSSNFLPFLQTGDRVAYKTVYTALNWTADADTNWAQVSLTSYLPAGLANKASCILHMQGKDCTFTVTPDDAASGATPPVGPFFGTVRLAPNADNRTHMMDVSVYMPVLASGIISWRQYTPAGTMDNTNNLIYMNGFGLSL